MTFFGDGVIEICPRLAIILQSMTIGFLKNVKYGINVGIELEGFDFGLTIWFLGQVFNYTVMLSIALTKSVGKVLLIFWVQLVFYD